MAGVKYRKIGISIRVDTSNLTKGGSGVYNLLSLRAMVSV